MRPEARLFLDTSALFSGIWSQTGGARMILKLGEAGALIILVSPQVLAEIQDVVGRKAPGQLSKLALLLDRSQVEVVPSAPPDRIAECMHLTRHPGDARALADAWTSRCDFFVTLVIAHFLGDAKLLESIPFRLGTPGDFLAWFRNQLER